MPSFSFKVVSTSLGQVGSTILVIAVATAAIEVALYAIFGKLLKHKHTIPIMLLAPAVIGLALLIVYPLAYEIRLAFSNMSLRRFRNPTFGFAQAARNFKNLFTEPVLKQQHFFPVFGRTILWTIIQVTSHVTLGLGLAMLLNRPMKLRGFYRALLIVPWALPPVVAGLAWRGEFHFEYGFLNIMLENIGLNPVQWKSNPFWNFVAMNITNTWLGVPFMSVILLGGLQAIPRTFYEAAEIDGARGFRRFRNVTLPLLKPVMTPAVALGIIWTFNNFNVPYFINEFELETSDLLVTALFRSAFEYNRYGFAAAFALVIFIILFIFIYIYVRFTRFKTVEGPVKRPAKTVPGE